MEKDRFFKNLQTATETILTRRRAHKRIKKEKQKAKNPILDWIEAFLWAAGVVLLINQYLFQAYQIPSGSMIDTLLISDRIFVNKLVYGPELLPGIAKLPSPIKPKREDVIIFENPEYISRGPLFDIAQRVIFMLTLSLVDIDRDESGNPRVHFLIKRAAGMGGDRFQSRDGNMFVKFSGEDRWVDERDYVRARGFNHHLSRMIRPEEYAPMEAAARAAGYNAVGINAPAELSKAASLGIYGDVFSYEPAQLAVVRAANPHNARYRAWAAVRRLGWYVPEGRLLPLGDNRDNSKDGRYFGPVKQAKVLGKGSLKFWPVRRIGAIK